jgi:hypothetical protein
MRTDYLYHLHPNGRIAGRDDLEAEDDVKAIALADRAERGGAMELWEGPRMIRTFAAPRVTERRSN